MTYEEALTRLEALQPGGMKMGLERMKRALERLGHPERQLQVVHVAGTNGKGSTARMIQAMATAAGYRTGLYSSPAVTGLRDTITVDGEAISPAAFAAGTARILALLPQLEEVGGLSAFELTTLLALWYFAEQKTDLCVVECGMGGRTDATNVFDQPLAVVITPISLDHTAWLGESVEAIALQKCGIIRPGRPVITTPVQDSEALAVILEQAAEQGTTVRMPALPAGPPDELDWGRTAFTWRGNRMVLPLTGAFQQENACLAWETAQALEDAGFRIPDEVKVKGLTAATIPCRQERIGREPFIVVDGAHNPQGVAALARTLRQLPPPGPLTAVMGMLRDKDTAACAAMLGPLCARIICCPPASPRALTGEELADRLRPFCPAVEAAASPLEALRRAQTLADGGPLLVAGSFYLAAELRPFLTEGDSSGASSTGTAAVRQDKTGTDKTTAN